MPSVILSRKRKQKAEPAEEKEEQPPAKKAAAASTPARAKKAAAPATAPVPSPLSVLAPPVRGAAKKAATAMTSAVTPNNKQT